MSFLQNLSYLQGCVKGSIFFSIIQTLAQILLFLSFKRVIFRLLGTSYLLII